MVVLSKIFTIVLLLVISTLARTEPFIIGADLSWCQEREYWGVKYADNGVVKDVFDIFKEHKFNWIRLRLFVDPKATVAGAEESPYSELGFCDLAHTREMAKRIKKAGMKFLIDFHYSDTWADPGKQFKAVSWNGLSFEQLSAKVRSYTKECLLAFKADGTLPDMVQVGNEVYAGMIWPDGKISNMANFAKLINSGIDGVKDVDPDIKIMVHTICEGTPSDWYKNLINAGVKRIDVFGLSYYSEWHGPPDNLRKIVNTIAANHKTKIAIAEYADNHQSVNDIIFNLPDEQGIGTFCWEPTEWMESLFDWKNNRRETNSRIELYPQLSKKYGNDEFVSVNKWRPNTVPCASDNRSSLGWCGNGAIRLYLESPLNTEISLVTIQGKVAGQWRVSTPGMHLLKLPDRYKTTGKYVVILKQNGQIENVRFTDF